MRKFTIPETTIVIQPEITGAVGDMAYVTDALAPAFLVAIAGGGAIVTPVFYDGVNWVAH